MKSRNGEHPKGLTDGLSSRFLRTNRSALVPTLVSMHHQTHAERTERLHGRLEELLVFEILKDGDTEYHNFTVRALHKYVMKAIRSVSSVAPSSSPRGYMQRGSVVCDVADSVVEPTGDIHAQDPAARNQQQDVKEDNNGEVTWRERLGGFLHPRDLRKLVTPFSASNEPELIVRRHAMLLNIDPLRAIILRDRLIVLVPDGADSILVQLEKRIRGGNQGSHYDQASNLTRSGTGLSSKMESGMDSADSTGLGSDGSENDYFIEPGQGRERSNSLIDKEWAELEGKEWIDLPFELQSVDAVLSCVASILADDVRDLQQGANLMIAELVNPNADAGDHAQDVLRTMKNSVKEMMSRVNGFCRAIETLLEDYEDMALMNLSRLLTHPDRFIQPVPQAILEEESDEPELILEAQLQGGHTLTNALSLVEGQISSTEDFAVRKSDTIRNRLLYINMVISVLSLSVAIGSLIGSMFGMNVKNPYEDSEKLVAFRVIVWCTIGGIFCFALGTLFGIRQLGAFPKVL